ncbi:MAG: VOC family protein [Acidimicrobiia bacterium]
MLGEHDVVAFLATSDLDRARAFFTEVVGLSVIEDTPFACVLDAHGTHLRVTPVSDVVPAPYTVLGWVVPDMAAAVRGLSDRGGVFERFDGIEQDELGVWTAPDGDQVAWFKDPDGNLLSLSRPANGA